MAEREFSPEDIQRGADEARLSGFGDFMFMDPGRHRGTSRQRRTSSSMTTRRRTSSSHRHTSRKRTSRHHLSGLSCSPWRNTANGRHQAKGCWKGGNMWVYRKRKRRC
ncbi:CotG/ExsB N-terminal domain-containing protein [Neobacillus niacini]|uniref:CotG/ExsB N-terminal domain-containing protein n=1 Tax=Neobacillus niacini TaxID=86668 RepID=UPI0021CB494D|nr:hypothetical protein [Neobacillus niacini]MCM3768536.1 hypothetical protein [Neobacillus niacini]